MWSGTVTNKKIALSIGSSLLNTSVDSMQYDESLSIVLLISARHSQAFLGRLFCFTRKNNGAF